MSTSCLRDGTMANHVSYRFRKTKSFGPFRVTLSKRGVGYSVGGKGYRLTKRADGRMQRTLSVPGTGLSHVTISRPSRRRPVGTSRRSVLSLLVHVLWLLAVGWIIATVLGVLALAMWLLPFTHASSARVRGLAKRALWPTRHRSALTHRTDIQNR